MKIHLQVITDLALLSKISISFRLINIYCLLFYLVPQPDPNTPKPEGRQIIPVKGEPLGVVSNWPPALQAALARWGATQAKSPALTVLDITGKPLYTLTYGEKRSDWNINIFKLFCSVVYQYGNLSKKSSLVFDHNR